ncbi:DUF1722 domain-containing protein [bacterium]|nr:DUF1722 domain-containing protein [bacterium]
MNDKIRLGISTCLLGEKVRYDGGHQHDRFLTGTLGKYVSWYAVCPEVECGLSVPREAMRLVGEPDSPRLITRTSGIDHTDKMGSWIPGKLKDLENQDLCGFIFKSKSPSSGYSGVKVYSSSGQASKKGMGIFAAAFIDHFPLIPVEDDGRLHDPKIRENFIERVFVFRRWGAMLQENAGVKGLIEFHAAHKLLLMAHSQKHYTLLGKMVADAGKKMQTAFFNEYIITLMEALKLQATKKKNTNVLMHLAGYFKKYLSKNEKIELQEVIDRYYKGFIPLIVPITLINHYVCKYDDRYLKKQYYLNPHPAELMLRNHV